MSTIDMCLPLISGIDTRHPRQEGILLELFEKNFRYQEEIKIGTKLNIKLVAKRPKIPYQCPKYKSCNPTRESSCPYPSKRFNKCLEQHSVYLLARSPDIKVGITQTYRFNTRAIENMASIVYECTKHGDFVSARNEEKKISKNTLAKQKIASNPIKAIQTYEERFQLEETISNIVMHLNLPFNTHGFTYPEYPLIDEISLKIKRIDGRKPLIHPNQSVMLTGEVIYLMGHHIFVTMKNGSIKPFNLNKFTGGEVFGNFD